MEGNSPPPSDKAGKSSGSGASPARKAKTTGDKESDEDSESESESSSSLALDTFRQQWEAELRSKGTLTSTDALKNNNANRSGSNFSTGGNSNVNVTVPGSGSNSNVASSCPGGNNNGNDEQAKRLFLMGVRLERQGEFYDAVRCYRRAIQLVPDIEYRVSRDVNNETSDPNSSIATPNESEDEKEDVNSDEDDDNEDPLIINFLRFIERREWLFFEKVKTDNRIHLSDFPVELLSYILRWVVSSELDVRSLDVLSSTSKGFYCLCRDDQLWKMACQRVWETCSLVGSEFSSYREMFLSRPRVRFDGCYISKVTYVRPGEHSFQDHTYRPWHLVEYFRYIRFFPTGHILFLTTADQPAMTVSGLRERNPRNVAVLRGRYHLYDHGMVSAFVRKTVVNSSVLTARSSKAIREPPEVTNFHMEFEISKLKNRPNWILKWVHYSMYSAKSALSGGHKRIARAPELPNNNTMITTFELNSTKYPALYFSRVKSYTTNAEHVLE